MTLVEDTVTAEDRTYTWEELDERAKDKIRYQESLSDELVEEVKDLFQMDLSQFGMEDIKAWWSLGHCQGDGVAFEGTVEAADITDPEFLPVLALLGSNRDTAVLGPPGSGVRVSWPRPITRLSIALNHPHNSGFHVSASGVNCTVYYDEDGADLEWNGSEEESLPYEHPVDDAVLAYFRELSARFEKNGYEVFDQVYDEEWMTERHEGYVFDEDGDVLEYP